VSVFYDPMIAKLITRGPDRLSALRALHRALDDWQVVGLPTNVPFLKRVLGTRAFQAGEVHTAFIQQHSAELLPEAPTPPSAKLVALAASQWLHQQGEALRSSLPLNSPWAAQPFLRLGTSVCGGGGASPLEVQPLDVEGSAAGEPYMVGFRQAPPAPPLQTQMATPISEVEISVSSKGGAEGEWSRVSLLEVGGSSFRALVDGESCVGTAVLQPPSTDSADTVVTLFSGGEAHALAVRDVARQASVRLSASGSGAGAQQTSVLAPMPGKIVRLLVAAGQQVSEGEPLVVLEAMKMEHTMNAKADSVVKGLHAKEGDVVSQRALLVSFEDPPAAAAA